MTPKLSWLVAAIQKARNDVEGNRAPNIGRADPHSFEAMAYLIEYDRLTQQGKTMAAVEGSQP